MLRIAICDDSKVDVEQLEAALSALWGYQIDYDVYFSAAELLKYTLKHKENYHLYIFDIEMPDMTGWNWQRKYGRAARRHCLCF